MHLGLATRLGPEECGRRGSPVSILGQTTQAAPSRRRRPTAAAGGAPATRVPDRQPPALTRRQRADRTTELTWQMHRQTMGTPERVATRNELVRINMRVAHAVAARYRDRGVPRADLEQAACEGLVKAVDRFDPSLHHDLLSYAVPTIRGEVLRYFRDQCWMIRPPRRVQELRGRIRAATADLALVLGRDPHRDELCALLDITRAEYDEALDADGCFRPTSLDLRLEPEGGGPTLGEAITVDSGDQDVTDLRLTLTPALRCLSERDREILYLRFFQDQTQAEIGHRLGTNQVQISRWLTRILERLRGELGEAPAQPLRAGASR